MNVCRKVPALALLLGSSSAFVGCGDVGREQAAEAAAASSGTEPATIRCPDIPGTWPMVHVAHIESGHFCVDSREVTNEQYAAFLVSIVNLSTLHPACQGMSDFAPKSAWPATPERGRHPVGAVTWCDAEAYCKTQGKRLCGGTQGEVIALDDASVQEWWEGSPATELSAACTMNGEKMFAYGNEIEADRCNYIPPAMGMVAVDSDAECEGGYDGIFFLEGNAWEWEGVCKFEGSQEGLSPPACFARVRSGCMREAIESSVNGVGVTDWLPHLGFRCCADVVPAN